MPFHLNAAQLFLTYPRCGLQKQEVYDLLELILLGHTTHVHIVDYIIAHELHSNGEPHIHVYLKLDHPLQTKRAGLLDLRVGDIVYHGNYQGCRSCKNVAKYVSKGEDYISNMDLDSILNRKSNRKCIAEKLVLGKRSLEEIIVEHPELIFGYLRLKNDINQFKADLEEAKALPSSIDTPWGFSIDFDTQDKCRHYWIYSSEPNRGKTTFGLNLQREYGAYVAAGDLTYWDVTKRTPIIILDDYNQRRFTGDTLNQLCDGTYQFRLFGRGVVKLVKYTVLVFSNSSISELYCPKYLPLLNSRFVEKYLN